MLHKKTILILFFISILYYSCKKDEEQKTYPDYKSKILGNWQQVQYKKGSTGTWKDSTSMKYFFRVDSVTQIWNGNPCNKSYVMSDISERNNFKVIDIYDNTPNCPFPKPFWGISLSIENIADTTMELRYAGDFGTNELIYVYERYKKL